MESAAGGVGDGEVGDVELARGPCRRAHHHTRRERDPEERELESEMAAGGRPEIAGVVPPLRPEVGVRAVI